MKKIFKIFDYFFIGFSYLISKKIIALGVIILFVSLLKTSLGYKEELLIKEHDMIFEKNNPNINYYNAFEEQNDYDNTSAISNYLSCYQKQIKPEELPDNIINYINSLKILYDENEEHYAFFYQDLFSGFTVSYNEDSPIFTASSIKGPAMIYLYEMASLGKVNLKDELVYSKEYYNTGTGMIKISPFGSSYTIKDLIMYSTVYSDNAAHNMLMDKYGRNNMLSFWKEKGTEVIFTENNNWGMINANDASIYMEELYRFFKEDKVYGKELMDNFIDSKGKFIRNKDGDIVASKGGWSGSAIHDVGIVFDENPYIVVGLSNLGNTSEYSSYFNKVNDFAYRLHNEYWKYKMNICNNINQYQEVS